jgi:hypothetical protein
MESVGELARDATTLGRSNGDAASRLPRRSRTRRGKAKLLNLSNLDQRTAACKAARALVDSLTASLGGDEMLSGGERALVERAALLAALIRDYETRWVAGQPITVGDWLAAVNTLRRVLVSLGLQKRARDVSPVSVAAYLREAADA